MDLLRIDEFNIAKIENILKNKKLFSCIVFIFCALIQFLIIWAYLKFKLSIIALAILSLFCITFIFQSLFDLYRKFKSSNWLLSVSDGNVYIKFRSYLYSQLSKNVPQIIRVEPVEITAFRETHVTDIIGRGRSIDRQKSVYLDIVVSGKVNLFPLLKALKKEHNLIGGAKNKKFKIEISKLNFPVMVLENNIIRVDISDACPKRKALFLMELKGLGIEEMEVCEKVFDLTKPESNSDVSQERIIELLKLGRRLDARDAIWHISNLNRKQAFAEVNNLEKEHILI